MINKKNTIFSLFFGLLVLYSYYDVFSSETQNYINSRFWLGLDSESVKFIIPLQILAMIGFIIFIYYCLSDKTEPKKGLLTYFNGNLLAILLFIFFISSTFWSYTTKNYLNNGIFNLSKAIVPSLTLIISAICVILITAGAFEANMNREAIISVLFFSLVVVLIDGVGWNSRLLFNTIKN